MWLYRRFHEHFIFAQWGNSSLVRPNLPSKLIFLCLLVWYVKRMKALVMKAIGIRVGSRSDVTSKMEHFVIIVNGWKPLTIITKSSIFDAAAVLDPSLGMDLYLPCFATWFGLRFLSDAFFISVFILFSGSS